MNTAVAPANAAVSVGSDFRRLTWRRGGLAPSPSSARAEAELAGVAHLDNDRLYDRVLGRHNAALERLLRAAAPDLAAAVRKLDLILRHQVFELTFGEASLAALKHDLARLAAGG